MRAFRFLISFLSVTIVATSPVLAADKLGVAIPYPVERIQLLNMDEPINRMIVANIGYGLFQRDQSGDVALELAQSIDVGADGGTYSVAIRDGAVFSNSDRIVAESVKASYHFLIAQLEEAREQLKRRGRLGVDIVSTNATGDIRGAQFLPPDVALSSALENIDSIDVVRRSSFYHSRGQSAVLRFRLREPDFDFLATVGTLPVINTNVANGFDARFAEGTFLSLLGPYQVRSNKPREGIVLESGGDFYRPGFPRARVVDFRYFEESQNALSALRVGAVDIIALPTKRLVEEVSDDPTLVVIKSPLQQMKRRDAPWVLVRQYWSTVPDELDRLQTDYIIVRRTLQMDERFENNFDMSGLFLR